MDRPVCHFWLNGNCKFGERCKNLHSQPRNNNNNNYNNNNNSNRFGALSNTNSFNRQPSPNPFQSASGGGRRDPFQSASRPAPVRGFKDDDISRDVIKRDLQLEKPEWPLSSYAGTQNAPKDILSGLEFSPEEIRVLYYIGRAEGNEQAAQQNELRLANEALQQINQAASDPEGARQFLLKGKTEHPNRWDYADRWDPVDGRALTKREQQNQSEAPKGFGSINNTTSGFGPQPSSSAFGSQQQSTSGFGAGGFGQPSAIGQKPNPFGAPSAPTGPSGPAFGQSGFGQPAFGQATAPSQSSAFGQPSAPTQTSAFGQPSSLGQASAFGQPSALGQASAFGKSTFGQASALGAASQPTQPSAFGSTTSGFGQLAANNSQGGGSAFGQLSAGQQSAFGAQSSAPQTNGFGQPSHQRQISLADAPMDESNTPTASNPFGSFGQPSAVAQPAPLNPFAPAQAAAAVTSTSSPFATQQPAAPTTSAFGQTRPAANSGFGQTSQASGFGTLTTSTAKPSGPRKYNIRHLLTDGQPPAANPATEAPKDMYGAELGAFEKAYLYAATNGEFEGDLMPELPPLANWVPWV